MSSYSWGKKTQISHWLESHCADNDTLLNHFRFLLLWARPFASLSVAERSIQPALAGVGGGGGQVCAGGLLHLRQLCSLHAAGVWAEEGAHHLLHQGESSRQFRPPRNERLEPQRSGFIRILWSNLKIVLMLIDKKIKNFFFNKMSLKKSSDF